MLSEADAEGAVWIKLMPSGTFKARDGRGPWIAGDRAGMERIVERTRSYHAGVDIVVDYDHQSVFAAKDGVGGTAKAAGWVKELQVRDDGIYGRVEWTDAAASSIRAKEYRYLSPVLPHRQSDGLVYIIQSAALTNTPALDLATVAASAVLSSDIFKTEGTIMEAILAALGLAEGSGEDAVLSALNAHLNHSTAVAKALGLSGDAEPAAVIAALNTVLSANTPDPTKYVPIAALSQLQGEFKALKEGVDGKDAETAVLSAIKDGKLAPALKGWGMDLYKADKAAFSAFIENAPTLTTSQLKQPRRDANAPAALDDAQAAAIAALGVDPEAYRKTLAAEEAAKEAR